MSVLNHLRGVGRTFAIAGTALLLIPTVAAAIECPTPRLPRPTEDRATIRARLEATGAWHAGQDPGPGAVRAAGPDALPQPEFRGSCRAG